MADSQPREQLVASELPTLILDGCLIYSETQPDRPLYELSNAPSAGRGPVYAIEKLLYRLSATDGQGRMHQRKRHVYDVRLSRPTDMVMVDSVMLEPKAGSRLAYRDVRIMPGVTQSWSSCKAAGHFEAGRSVRRILSHHQSGRLEWKRSADGAVVAVETKPARGGDGAMEGLPRLEMKMALDAKDLDLLVTMWSARLWKTAQKELKEPFSWERCKLALHGHTPFDELVPPTYVASVKRIASTNTGPNRTRLSGAGAVR